jgi:hypothetical protein
VGILGQNYNDRGLNFKKGARFDTDDINFKGVVVVTGQGQNEVIPFEYIKKFVQTYEVVSVDGFTKTIKKVKNDVTKETMEMYNNARVRAEKINKQGYKSSLRSQIAEIRKAIKYVTSGEAQNDLTDLIGKLNNLV